MNSITTFIKNIKSNKKVFFPLLICLLIIIIIIVFFSISSINDQKATSSTEGGELTEETDPLSGQTIETINEEPEESGSDENTIGMIGFDGFYDHNYSVTQYEILTDNLSTFFKENYKDITRISIVKDSIKCPDDETYCNSDVVINTGEKFRLYTDTELLNSKTILYIQLKDSKGKVILEKEEDRSDESTGENSSSDEE